MYYQIIFLENCYTLLINSLIYIIVMTKFNFLDTYFVNYFDTKL